MALETQAVTSPAITTQTEAAWRRCCNPAVLAAFLLFACTALWLFHFRWPLGRHDEWLIIVQVVAVPWPLSAWLLPLAVLALCGGLAAYAAYDRFQRATTRRAQHASTILCIFALAGLTLLWPWSLLEPAGGLLEPGGLVDPGGAQNLIDVTWSDVANEYFAAAYQINDVRAFTRDYTTRWQNPKTRTQAHIATHPPGATLFYYGARRVFESFPPLQNIFFSLTERLTNQPVAAAANEATKWRNMAAHAVGNADEPRPLPNSAAACAVWCAFLLSLAMAGTVPAVYLLAATPAWVNSSETEDSDRVPSGQNSYEARGLLAAALFAVIPSVQLFAFTLDALIACGVAWTLVLGSRRFVGGSSWWLLAAGVMLGLTCFISIGVLAGFALLGIALVCNQLRQGIQARSVVADFAAVIAGFVGIWLLLMAFLPMQPIAILKNAIAAHHFATLSYRSPWAWPWLNLVTIALFAGWPIAIAIVSLLFSLIQQSRAAGRNFLYAIKYWTPGEIIGWATVLTMLLLTVSGSVRGEVERLWLFLLPPLCVLASFALLPLHQPDKPERSPWQWKLFLLFQILQTMMMATALEPLSRPY